MALRSSACCAWWSARKPAGAPNVEKAAAPAPFVALFTANDVRAEHVKNRAADVCSQREVRFLRSPGSDEYTGNRCEITGELIELT